MTEKVLCYQCPKCESAAFYLSGTRDEYVNGSQINASKMKQILRDRWNDDFVRCQHCQFAFTTGVLYLKNIKEKERG